VNTDQIAAIAAFGSAVGSAITMAWYRRAERKRSQEDCEQRIAALKEGVEIGEEHVDRGGESAAGRRFRVLRRNRSLRSDAGDDDDDGERDERGTGAAGTGGTSRPEG